MQVIHYLPTVEQLALPPDIASKVVQLLIEPFGELENAQAYWAECPSTLVCLNRQDQVAAAVACLGDITQQLIADADSCAEFDETFEGYTFSLTVYNDEGAGLYLIRPADMDLSEVLGHE